MRIWTNDILGHRIPSVKRQAFSMTEMVFAIFILGLGLLFTSSMFPIAWYKAREVAEVTTTQSCVAAGRDTFMRVARVNNWEDLEPDPPPPIQKLPATSLFPHDWYPLFLGDAQVPMGYPNSRVHALNFGNFLANPRFGVEEEDDLSNSGDPIAVSDHGWRLNDQLVHRFADSFMIQKLAEPDSEEDPVYVSTVRPGERLVPPMKEPPAVGDPNYDKKQALWAEQFAGRRYCWSALFRFSEIYGPDPDSDPNNKFDSEDPFPLQNNLNADEIEKKLGARRTLTVYTVSLKRPDNARYARQEGIVGNGNTASWDSSKQMDHPRALASDHDVLIPTPWRFKASLVSIPAFQGVPSGIPSEIRVTDTVLAEMLVSQTVLIDDRNGQIYRITQRRTSSTDPATVVLVLDKEYTSKDVYGPAYVPFPDNEDDAERNWLNEWEWEKRNCDADKTLCDNSGASETELADRYYWVFPPPVESERAANGVPIFAGSPPVVDIETRQVVLKPRS
ncbi:MAG: hypothetical protein DHS20C16_03030 [Phycisphaerae bacterium]|nr:MAG: hypothetical protein DHS20C16_03030 [Phycisphaerae bacterium]